VGLETNSNPPLRSLGAGFTGTPRGELLLRSSQHRQSDLRSYNQMDEETKVKLDRCRAIHGGHRGVVTKLIKEIDEILSQQILTLYSTECYRYQL